MSLEADLIKLRRKYKRWSHVTKPDSLAQFTDLLNSIDQLITNVVTNAKTIHEKLDLLEARLDDLYNRIRELESENRRY